MEEPLASRGWQTPSNSSHPHYRPHRASCHHRPGQPSYDRITNRAFCQQSFHNNPIRTRVRIPFRSVPDPSPSSSPPSSSAVCSLLHVPSHSRFLRRPPCSMRNFGGFEKPSRAFGTGGSPSMQRSRGQSDHPCAGVRPQPHRIDNRRIEVMAHGFPLHNGAQLAVDTTMVSPLTSSGQPRPQGCQPGSPALRAARKAKERTYPELVRGNRCRLVVLAIEVGGKWGHEAAEFLRLLVQARNRSVPYVLRTAAIQASIARWSAHPCGTSAVCSQPHPTRPSKPEQHRRQHATPEHPPATPP